MIILKLSGIVLLKLWGYSMHNFYRQFNLKNNVWPNILNLTLELTSEGWMVRITFKYVFQEVFGEIFWTNWFWIRSAFTADILFICDFSNFPWQKTHSEKFKFLSFDLDVLENEKLLCEFLLKLWLDFVSKD